MRYSAVFVTGVAKCDLYRWVTMLAAIESLAQYYCAFDESFGDTLAKELRRAKQSIIFSSERHMATGYAIFSATPWPAVGGGSGLPSCLKISSHSSTIWQSSA